MKLVIANWKMNKTLPEVRAFVETFSREIESVKNVTVGIAAPFPFLAAARDPQERWWVVGQDCSAEKSGAFTGEVSADMLASERCRAVLIGHSERRRHFGEGEEILAKKLTRAAEALLQPVLCVGETLAEREAGKTEAVLRRQLSIFSGAGAVAYEPVWAIGTGRNATPEEAEETMAFIARELSGKLDAPPILYGGSVTPDNAAGLVRCRSFAGFLVGGASLDPHTFSAICRSAG
jgi:triosephosphate isomerase